MTCKNCVHSQTNKKENYCLEYLGMGGDKTWYTPIFVNDPEEMKTEASEAFAIPEVTEAGSVNCISFERI